MGCGLSEAEQAIDRMGRFDQARLYVLPFPGRGTLPSDSLFLNVVSPVEQLLGDEVLVLSRLRQDTAACSAVLRAHLALHLYHSLVYTVYVLHQMIEGNLRIYRLEARSCEFEREPFGEAQVTQILAEGRALETYEEEALGRFRRRMRHWESEGPGIGVVS